MGEERVEAARELLAPYTFAAVCDASEAASSFYLWSSGAIREWDDWKAASQRPVPVTHPIPKEGGGCCCSLM